MLRRILAPAEGGRPARGVVAGESGRLLMTGRHSGRVAARIPGAALRTVPGAGHGVHHTSTAGVLAAIDEAAGRAGAASA